MESSKPLTGIRVIDLTRILAGPYGTMLLADLGADVIKIESPAGDDTRRWGPPFVEDESAYFLSVNRGKRSVVLDLNDSEDQKRFRQLVQQSDVVVENFRVGTMERWGLDYEVLSRDLPGLIYASITGYGNLGPDAERPGYATLVEAMSGLMSITGEPHGEPMKVGVALVDVIAGCHLLGMVNAALLRRERSGAGARIDLSLLESCMSALVNQAGNALASDQTPERLGNAHPSIVPYELFHTASGPVMVAVGNDSQFARFSEMIGRAEWISDPRYRTNEKRVKNRRPLVEEVSRLLLAHTAQHWVDQAARRGVPLAPVNDLHGALATPQIKALNMVCHTNHARLGQIASIRHPARFDGHAPTPHLAPPDLGEHTAEVLADLSRGDMK